MKPKATFAKLKVSKEEANRYDWLFSESKKKLVMIRIESILLDFSLREASRGTSWQSLFSELSQVSRKDLWITRDLATVSLSLRVRQNRFGSNCTMGMFWGIQYSTVKSSSQWSCYHGIVLTTTRSANAAKPLLSSVELFACSIETFI